MKTNRIITVFLASPMDLVEERAAIQRILSGINENIGRKFDIAFDVVCWEKDVVPDKGIDAQDVVNRQVAVDYDVFVAIFKNRIGTKTNRAISGTIEEYERALVYRCSNERLKIMGYFIDGGAEDSATNSEIAEVKRRFSSDGVLYYELDSSAFETSIYRHFSTIILEYIKSQGQSHNSIKTGSSQEKTTRSTAVALIDQSDRVLLVKRSLSSKVGAGLWQIPGGKTDEDESPRECACREISEELGISLSAEDLNLIHVFQTGYANSATKRIEIYLYSVEIDSSRIDCNAFLRSEIDRLEWFPLCDLYYDDRIYLGINRAMLTVLWRERNCTAMFDRALHFCADSNSDYLPSVIPGLSKKESAILLSFLSVTGVAAEDPTPPHRFRVDRKLLSAMICISRAGMSLFEDGADDSMEKFSLQASDYALLKQHRERSLYSHKALLASLSCKTTIDNSVRNVCDVLVFGEHNGNKYILLRWDFYSKKYQIFGGGVSNDEEQTPDDKARSIIIWRTGDAAIRFLDLMAIKRFTTYHFSAGSVNDDPILRRYIIDAVLAKVHRQFQEDFLSCIEIVNTTTKLEIEYSLSIAEERKKELNYFQWCSIEQLFEHGNTYNGKRVQGFNELLKSIGKPDILRFSQNAVPLKADALSTSEEIELLQRKLDNSIAN